MMREATLFVPHAIFFINDPGMRDIEIPEYVNDRLVAFTDSCISVGTQADVDGPVTVRLFDESRATEKATKKVFTGDIETPDRKVGVVSSEDVTILELPVQNEKTSVTIWVDDTTHPTKIFVQAV